MTAKCFFEHLVNCTLEYVAKALIEAAKLQHDEKIPQRVRGQDVFAIEVKYDKSYY